MSSATRNRARGSLAPLVVVTVAALVFAVLLVLVRLQWAPLESADRGAATSINGLIAGHATAVAGSLDLVNFERQQARLLFGVNF